MSGAPTHDLLVVALIAGFASLLLTGAVRRFALQRSLLDIPNERSSHSIPTPRGGGLAIAIVTLSAVAWAGVSGAIASDTAIGLFGGGVLVTLVGWVDDIRPLRASVRALVQAVGAGWFLFFVGGMPLLRLGAASYTLGVAGWLLALVGIVWSVNLYNFMDGIDGLAGGQALIAGGVGAALLTGGGEQGLALVAAALAGSCLGFLGWNWAPARIFMGDVGSGLLGFFFGTMAVLSDRGTGPSLGGWLLLGGVFLFDATATVVRRMLRGERWYAAHRSHAYQRAMLLGWGHARVASAALLLAALGAGLAAAVAHRPEAFLASAVGYAVVLGMTYLGIERVRPMFPPKSRSELDSPGR